MSEQVQGKGTCQDHGNLEIIAVQETQTEQQVIKYLCVNCLIQMIGVKNIFLYDQFIEIAKERRNKCEKEQKEKTQERVNYMNELQSSFLKLDELVKGVIGQLQNTIGQKIAENQKELEDSQVDSKNMDENNSKLQSTSGGNDEKEKSTLEQESIMISNFLKSIKEQLHQISASQECTQIIKLIKKIEQSFQIKLEPLEMELIVSIQINQKTPSLKQLCKIHKQEIIMIDLNQNESQNRFACVQCVQEIPNQYVGLLEVIDRLRKYTEQQQNIKINYHTKRKIKFNKAIQMLAQLKDKYNKTILEIISSLDIQFKLDNSLDQKNNDNTNTNIQELDEQEIQDVVDILCQKDQHANQKKKQEDQDQEDSKVYSNLKINLDNLMLYDIVTIHNLMSTLNEDQLEQLSIDDFIYKNESNNKLDHNYFIKKFIILQQYISLIDNSFNFYKSLQKEVDESNQDIGSQSLRYQKEYQQFQSNSTTIKTFIMAEENEKQLKVLQEQTLQQQSKILEDSKQIDQLSVQIKELSEELSQLKQKQLELQEKIKQDTLLIESLQVKLKEYENTNKQLQQTVETQEKKADVQSETINKTQTNLQETTSKLKSREQELSNYQQQHNEVLKELQCVYQFVNISWEIGTNTILNNEYCLKILRTIEEKMKKKIKNQYLIYSGKKDGLNSQAFWKCVNKTSNLLMIFKSKSGNIFGGFSPCQWLQIGGAFSQDNTLSSFLFSQTHDLIYPLKEINKQYAIYCHQSFGPTFGNGHDLQIGSDFQSGYSNLGYHYQWNEYQYVNSTHLFGQLTPNIEECEIMMLTFK